MLEEQWEQIKPSWKKVKVQNKIEMVPQVTISRSKPRIKRQYDRISLNKAARNLLGLTESCKCHLLVNKSLRKAAIKIPNKIDQNDPDCFTLSVSASCVSIRKTGLIELFGLPDEVGRILEKLPFRTELRTENGMYVFTLPDKSIGTADMDQIEVPEDFEVPSKEDIELANELAIDL